jgi:density-regulated protein DRP1
LAAEPQPEEFKALIKVKKTKTVDPSNLKISIQMKKRSGKKMVTEIKGLELFGIKLKQATKTLGKKFASGCSVVKEAGEEMIDLQGTFEDEVIDFLMETYPEIPAKAFDRKATTTKKKKKK